MKQIRVGPPNLMTIPCHVTTTLALLNLNLEVTPDSEQLTSKNTTYAELWDSLITQEEEDLILQGRVKTNMSTEIPSTETYQKMPPPPPPKKGEWGYEAYMNRMAAEEQKYNEEQAQKWEEWNQTSNKFKIVKYAVLPPMSFTLMMMCYGGSSGMMTTLSPTSNGQWNCNWCVPAITENLPGECICPDSGQRQSISWESSIFPAHQHQTT